MEVARASPSQREQAKLLQCWGARLPRPPGLVQVWLATEGSPMSHIERCDFTDERDDLQNLEFTDFTARHR